MARSSQVRGLIPVLATPFHPGGELDTESLRRLVDFELAAGVAGLAVFGLASEAFSLTAAERAQILKVVTTRLDYHVPVIAGICATGHREAVEQAQAAVNGGASVVMVLPPHLVKPSAAQLIDFYGAVAGSVEVPVMVQDAPAVTGVSMPVPLLAELSKLGGVASVKIEAQPTAPKVGEVVAATANDFLVVGGQNAMFVLEEYARGAAGTMPACEFPDLLVPVLQSWDAGEGARARAAFARLLPLVRFGLQPGIAWSIHKHVLVRRGVITSATVRPPAIGADQGSLEALHELLDDLKIGSPG